MNTKSISKLREKNIQSAFIALASKKLTAREKMALKIIFEKEEQERMTQTVKYLAQQLNCAESTSWSIVRSLHSLELIAKESEKIVLSPSALIFMRGNHA